VPGQPSSDSVAVESQRVVYEVLRRDVPHINLFSVW
jgi:hypothetical protein